MDAEDVTQIADSLRAALSSRPDQSRRVLDEFGWQEMLVDEPKVAVGALFTLSGELLLPGSKLDAVLLAAAGPEFEGLDARVVLPAPGHDEPAGRPVTANTVKVDGVVQTGGGPVLVPLQRDDGRLGFVLCDAPPELPGERLDGPAGWVRVDATIPVDRTLDVADTTAAWGAMIAAARRALAHELVGVTSAMVRMTVEHVCSREQFSQSLGSFQAVKHQLADVHLWHQVAELSAEAAWEIGDGPSAALAKAAATRSARAARAACQQLLGGMGFTWEHQFHRYLRRALTLEPLFGGASAIHSELGAAVRAQTLDTALISL